MLLKCKRRPHIGAVKVKGQGKFLSALFSNCKDTGENKKGFAEGFSFLKESKLVMFLFSHTPPVWQESVSAPY